MGRQAMDVNERFWSKVDKTGDCWLWTGTLSPKGCGQFWFEGGNRPAHRVAYRLAIGPIPDGAFVRQTCDIRACVNPNHLFLRTQANVCSVDGCERLATSRGWCERHYQRWYRIGTTVAPVRPSPESRFWARVDKDGDCWTWMARRQPRGGYGQFQLDGRTRSAHRVAWTLTNGPIPDGLCVLHRCDNPPCVNPEHLWLGHFMANKTHCIRGHEFTPENTRVRTNPSGGPKRECRACINIRQRESR